MLIIKLNQKIKTYNCITCSTKMHSIEYEYDYLLVVVFYWLKLLFCKYDNDKTILFNPYAAGG